MGRKILQENPRQNPPKFILQKSPTHFCRGAGPRNQWACSTLPKKVAVQTSDPSIASDCSSLKLHQRRHNRLYLHGPHPRKTMVWNHGLHPLRTMVLKTSSATTSMFFSIARCQGGDFQDHGFERAQTMVQDHGFARVGTMQVQAIMPP